MSPGAQAIEQTRQLLAHFPDARVQIKERPGMIEIVPEGEGTFSVSIYDEGEDAMVAADRWHTHYEDPEQAAWCAFWLLTPFYRVVHEFKGGVLVAVWIERYEESGWEGFEPVFYLNPEDEQSWELQGEETFGRRYLQQAILPSPQPYQEIVPGARLEDDGLPVDAFIGKRTEEGRVSLALPLYEDDHSGA